MDAPPRDPGPVCDQTVYGIGPSGEPHRCGDTYYTLTNPSGQVRHFCDTDCLRGMLAHDYEQALIRLHAELVTDAGLLVNDAPYAKQFLATPRETWLRAMRD